MSQQRRKRVERSGKENDLVEDEDDLKASELKDKGKDKGGKGGKDKGKGKGGKDKGKGKGKGKSNKNNNKDKESEAKKVTKKSIHEAVPYPAALEVIEDEENKPNVTGLFFVNNNNNNQHDWKWLNILDDKVISQALLSSTDYSKFWGGIAGKKGVGKSSRKFAQWAMKPLQEPEGRKAVQVDMQWNILGIGAVDEELVSGNNMTPFSEILYIKRCFMEKLSVKIKVNNIIECIINGEFWSSLPISKVTFRLSPLCCTKRCFFSCRGFCFFKSYEIVGIKFMIGNIDKDDYKWCHAYSHIGDDIARYTDDKMVIQIPQNIWLCVERQEPSVTVACLQNCLYTKTVKKKRVHKEYVCLFVVFCFFVCVLFI